MNHNTNAKKRRTASEFLFDGAFFPPDAYCEALASSMELRQHWQPLMAAFDGMGREVLDKCQDRVRRMRHEDGATYNPFDDASGWGTPWALEILPLPLTAGEWADLEAGLIQRATVLEKILSDVYGPQDLLKNGRIPPELVFANPNFLRTCHGVKPVGNRFLAYYAADLYRGKDGLFRVLRDYAANPSGLGYALENRIIMSRIFSELYQDTRIQRLAPWFQTFHRSLVERSGAGRGVPEITLLSPGPDSRIYFEHALLSRYLGYPVVEGRDLTVRNGRLFLKKLAGLEPVDVVFRHTEDSASDPFALRRETAGGVSGLIQVAREGNLVIINPIGSGFVDTPVLPAFLPSLCRLLTGEDLLLESHPTYWCGGPEGMRAIGEGSKARIIAPAMAWPGHGAPPNISMAEVQAAPYAFMAQEPLLPAVAPAWSAGGMTSRYLILRVFVCATAQGFAVMPGGMAITASDIETLTAGPPERRQSKDIWILSEQPVEPFSLLGGMEAVPEVTRGSDLPSRVADHLLWLGRYLERAEGMIRVFRSFFRRLSGEARPNDVPELPFLLNLLRSENIIPPANQEGGNVPSYRDLVGQLKGALFKQDRIESVAAVLGQVREAARNVRDRLSPDSWRVINRLEEFSDVPANDPLELLDGTLFTLSAFSGLAMESMTRGLGWRFMDMGRRMERALNHAGLIRASLPEIRKSTGSALEALLEVSDSIMTYRARYRTAFQLAPVLDLLLMDETNPKSLAFQVSRLADHVEHLPRHSDRRFASPEERLALEMLTSVRLLDLTGMTCNETEPDTSSLSVFLENMETRLTEFSQQISGHYLSRIPSTPHFSANHPGDAGL